MQPTLELRLAEIKQYLHETVGKQWESAGYKFIKKDLSYKKKKGKDYIEFNFRFTNYAPVNYEVSFSILVMAFKKA